VFLGAEYKFSYLLSYLLDCMVSVCTNVRHRAMNRLYENTRNCSKHIIFAGNVCSRHTRKDDFSNKY